LTPEQIESFLRGLADEGYSANSVRIIRTTLSQVLKEAERRGHVARNAAALTHLPAKARPPVERDALSADEAGRLLAAAKADRLAAYWVLALTTGARRGELLGLAWDDVDLDAATMTIRRGLRRAEMGGWEVGPTKTTASVRTVRLGPSAVAALTAHKRAQRREQVAAKRWTDTGLVFTTTVGTHLDPNTIRHRWTALCKAAGVDGRVPHELRHTAGSLAVDAGVSLAEVADQLGHADVNMLARTYRHRTRPVVEGVAGVMEAFVTTPPKRAGRRDNRTLN
jgi:integrase